MTLKNEGKIKDLAEKLEKGEITFKDVVKELEERKLTERATMKYEPFGYVAWALLCFLPAVAKFTELGFLYFLTQMPTMEFPHLVIYLAVALFLAVIPFTAAGMHANVKHGGCRSEDHTIILQRKGIYGIMRHPSTFAFSMFFGMLPIMLSEYVPFTPLSAIGIIFIFVFHYYASAQEEKMLDIPKWGDEYIEYMKEVPRWNFIRGMWNLRKKRK